MSTRTIIATIAGAAALATAGFVAFSVSAPAAVPKPKPGPGPDPLKLGGFAFAEWNTTIGGDAKTPLPTIVFLHDQQSGPDDVAALVKGIESPARILVPLGAIGGVNNRSYVDPENPDPMALQKVAVDLQAFLFAAIQDRPIVGRLIVVGLGTSGLLAVSLGMFASPVVSLAIAMGGSFAEDLVPIPQTGTTQIVMLVQETSPTLAQTTEAFKVAATRGFSVELVPGDFDLPITTGTAKAFLWPRLLGALGKP